jgi:serine/threonine protein phosphatase PrpC
LKFGATGMQGWRNTMEDTHIVSLDLANGVSFFGVYDGHGGILLLSDEIGNEVADFVKEHLIDELKTLPSFKSGAYDQALRDIYVRIDEML